MNLTAPTKKPGHNLWEEPMNTMSPCRNCGGGLVPISEAGESLRYRLFVVHGLNGNVAGLRYVGADVASFGGQIVGVQANGVKRNDLGIGEVCICGVPQTTGESSMEDFADRYARWIAEEIRKYPAVPWAVAGYSSGGLFALEISRILKCEFGLETDRPVILIDCLAPHLDWTTGVQQLREVRNYLLLNRTVSALRSLSPWLIRSVQNRITRRVFAPAELRRTQHVSAALGHSDFEARGLVDLTAQMDSANHVTHRTFDVSLHLVQSASIWPMFPTNYEWDRYVKSVTRSVVPGDHHTLLMPGPASVLAQIIDAQFCAFDLTRDSGRMFESVEIAYDSFASRPVFSVPAFSDLAPSQNVESTPDACVVIATFNRSGSLRLLLQDLAVQRSSSTFEVVVVNDGGQSDVRGEISDDLPFRVHLINRPNGGPAQARDTAIDFTSASIIVIVDDDMRVGESFVEAHLSAHRNGARVVYGLITGESISTDRGPLFGQFHQKHIDMWLEECRNGAVPRGDRLCTGNVSFRLEDYISVGGFDRSLVRCEDRDLGIRLENLGIAFAYSEQAESRHRSDHTDVHKWRQRSAIYGRSDLIISRKHPGRADLSPWSFLQILPRSAWPLLFISACAPWSARPIGRLIYGTGMLFDRMGLTGLGVRLAGLTYGVDYYSGAGEEWGCAGQAIREYRVWRKTSTPPGGTLNQVVK